MAHKPVNVIEIRIWDRRVGAIALDPRLDYYAFEYDPKFAASGIDLSPLRMPLSQAGEPFVFADLPELTFKRLPPMVADALPDDFGNALIDAWMAQHGVQKRDITPLDRLAYMGRRGFGALEFKPARGSQMPGTTAIKLSKLVDAARAAVTGNLLSDELSQAALNQIIQVGTSAGGARAKAAIAWNPTTHEIRAGQFGVEDGFEHWLLKFDGMGPDRELGGSKDYGRIEYAYHLMAINAGIEMSPCRLLEETGRAHFMTRRFDRDVNQKHHMLTLCAMAHLDYKQKATHDYSQLFQTIESLRLGYRAKEEAFRRMIFNIAAANCDDHTKNFSFLLKQDAAWMLAPAYDVAFAHNPTGKWTSQHLMSINGKFKDITRDDMLALADQFAIGTAVHVIDRVGRAVAKWQGFARQAGLNQAAIERIAHYHDIPD